MAFTVPIYANYSDNILVGAVITSTVAPIATYALTTLASNNPAERVRFGAATVTVTFTLSGAALGEILVIPMHNLTPGSSTVLTLTNAAGLSIVAPVPALEGGGFPPTLVLDFSAQANKTSTVWNLVIASNASNVVLGGAVAIYPKKTFASVTKNGSVSWDEKERLTWNMVETPNEYATPYVQDYGTQSKQIEFTAHAAAAGVLTLVNTFLANHGRTRPSLFWMDPSNLSGAYHGRFQKTLEAIPITSKTKAITVLFDEWPKGEVL